MKYEKEVSYSHLDDMQVCQAGVEVHFKDDRCYENGEISRCRQKRRPSNNSTCIICFRTRGLKPN